MSLPFELDHVVVFVSVDAPEAKALESLGLTGFGGTTRHGNLGTASTAFFFENVYLELLWVHDETATQEAFAPVGFDVQARMTWRRPRRRHSAWCYVIVPDQRHHRRSPPGNSKPNGCRGMCL
jgi:hypothetical protein